MIECVFGRVILGSEMKDFNSFSVFPPKMHLWMNFMNVSDVMLCVCVLFFFFLGKM